MINEIEQVKSSAKLLYSETEVEAAINQMAHNITLLLSDRDPLILCVMNGGVVVAGKLLTRLNFPLTFDGINASRYHNETSGGDIKWLLKPTTPLKDRTVLIIDDILDEGFTLEAIYQYCREQGARSIYSAVLVNKKLDHKKPIIADFTGLETGNHYLFGYGMDYKGYLRNAAGIFACHEEEL
ncbi:MAG: hypoxanthine-guanine phosphoribosyltransferase [Methylococcales bacterium]|nr:hypoxanthine-guanine phosphoribosyltransferase [Methylococcales bacterium]